MQDSYAKEQADRRIEMLTTPVPRLVTRLAIPTMVSMLISSIYSMADTFFVSQLGSSASAAVGVSFTVMMFIQAMGFTLGMGSGSLISRLVGAKDTETAHGVASTGFFVCIVLSVIGAVAGLVWLRPLVQLLGATETITAYSEDYVRLILIGAPYMATSFVLNNILRSQGKSFYAMIGLTAGGILNMILDPICIFVLDMGVAGAALATIISQLVSFVILLVMVLKKSPVRISLPRVRLSLLKRILPIGAPSFFRQGLASVGMVLLNRAAGVYGDTPIAAITITLRITNFSFTALIGFLQGFQPVAGYNFGAKHFLRVRKAITFSLSVMVACMVAIGLVLAIGAPIIFEWFIPHDETVKELGTRALRLMCMVMPILPWTVIVDMAHQALGLSVKATILSIARQGLFFIPFVLVFPRVWGLDGVLLAMPIADLFACLMAIPFGVVLLKNLNNQIKANPHPEL